MGWKKLRRVGKWVHKGADWMKGKGGRESDRRKAVEEQLGIMTPEDRANMELWTKAPEQYQEQMQALLMKYGGKIAGGKYSAKTGLNFLGNKVAGSLNAINQELPGSYESSKGAISEAEELRRRRYAGTLLTRDAPLADATGGYSGKTLLGQ